MSAPAPRPARPTVTFAETLWPPAWCRWLAAALLAFVAGIVVLVVFFAPEPVTLVPALIVGVGAVAGASVAVLLLVGHQRVEVTDADVLLAFTPLWRRRIPLEQAGVSDEEEVTGLELGGFGVRLVGDGRTALIANPGPMLGVVDHTRSKRYLVRTDRADELRAALTAPQRG